MEQLVIHGGRPLAGTIEVSGSKNSALPVLAACLMADGVTRLHGVPRLSDTDSMVQLLRELGCRVDRHPSKPAGACAVHPPLNGTIDVRVEHEGLVDANCDIAQKMRAGISVLGPLLARRGRAVVPLPGGCNLGPRPIDLHLRGLAKLGATFHMQDGAVIGEVPGGRLKGTTLYLGGTHGPTVLGTINVMSAAAMADGVTRIVGAACEPEVIDCADLLNRMGANIRGAGSNEIVIDGVESLHGVEHRVIPDRIEAGTFLMAAAIAGGELTLTNCHLDHLVAVLDRLEETGVQVSRVNATTARVVATTRPRPVDTTTWPYPGFPTDLQAQLMAVLSVADGTSVITERVYPERFKHADELALMGARIQQSSPMAFVQGVPNLTGASVTATDLRASAALVLAGLAATGVTRVGHVSHIDRGYEKIERKLAAVGADVERVTVKPSLTVTIPAAVPASQTIVA